jgi:hypothetical protein
MIYSVSAGTVSGEVRMEQIIEITNARIGQCQRMQPRPIVPNSFATM